MENENKEIKIWIYKHTNLINGKCYVGQTSRKKPKERWGKNGYGYREQSKIFNAITKYGWQNFKSEIIDIVYSYNDANESEVYYINSLDSINNGYNTENGGWLPKNRLSALQKLKEKCSGGNNPRARKIVCIDTEEIYDCVYDVSRKLNLHASSIVACCKGRFYMTGKLHFCYLEDFVNQTYEIKQTPQHKNSKPVRCIETGEIFPTASSAGKSIGVNSVSACAMGMHQTIKGFHWEYVNEKDYMQPKPPFDCGAKEVICIETKEVFKSGRETAIKNNVTPSKICNCCNGKQATCNNLHFMFYDEYLKKGFSCKSIPQKNKYIYDIENDKVYKSISETKRNTIYGHTKISNECLGKRNQYNPTFRYATNVEVEKFKIENNILIL